MPARVFLKNGEEVKINDHVYCSPSWAVRDGTPYSIARIMEFLPPEDVPRGPEADNYLYTRVRLAWYYRPGDVSDRSVADSRLLLAAIFSEVCDINQLRARCHVVHRDKISDLSGWKKRPDRFYFNRLFDPYVKKEFEIIPSTDVRNLPDNIRETLISRYEYVVAEKEMIPDLTDSRFFHMRCVQPPLMAKPSRGYGWTCAPCSRKHEEEVDSHDVRHATPVTISKKSNAPAVRGRGRPRKDKTQAEREENMMVKHFKMWPFRYFGQHTVAEDTLDPDDLIFPRTATRHGPKFQATVALAPELDIAPSDPDERGGDNTIENLGIINTLTEAEIAEVEACKRDLTNDVKLQSSVDWLTEVIRRFSEAALAAKPLTSVNMRFPMRLEKVCLNAAMIDPHFEAMVKWKKYETAYTDREWTRDEIAAFEDAIISHGAELRAVREEVATRSMPEVVRFYGLWKNSKVGEENLRLIQEGPPPKVPHRQYTSPKHASDGQHVGLSDEEGSVIDQPSKSPSCAACRTRESTTWWKAPKGLATNIMCDSCGTGWRKYADLVVRPVRDEAVSSGKRLEKREGTPLTGPATKRARTSASAQSTPPPAVVTVPQIRCLICMKNGPIGKVLKCKTCQIRIHAGSCGAVADPAALDQWTCELCRNQETLEASVNPDCLLCPRASAEERKNTPYPSPDSFLRACKPTEGQGWAHVLCSVFTGELMFTDASKLRVVEGLIKKERASSKTTVFRHAAFVPDQKAPSFDAAIVTRSIMRRVLGNLGINSASKFNL
ncbi:hypothetical protein D9615_007375 [Tricholomella constricta]|uniref:Uncharacterized protein n=1 Tax=Tricholomella constricta TaxID=117010 RepID=A0A8H5GYA0_9AGAR|nr:hypothetical protein D9615_007375 [Tricholomella constricta]